MSTIECIIVSLIKQNLLMSDVGFSLKRLVFDKKKVFSGVIIP